MRQAFTYEMANYRMGCRPLIPDTLTVPDSVADKFLAPGNGCFLALIGREIHSWLSRLGQQTLSIDQRYRFNQHS